jgi:hypothetical protein
MNSLIGLVCSLPDADEILYDRIEGTLQVCRAECHSMSLDLDPSAVEGYVYLKVFS